MTRSCGFKQDNGDLKCWGANWEGELGQGDTKASRGGEIGGECAAWRGCVPALLKPSAHI